MYERVVHKAEVTAQQPFYLQRDGNAARLAAADGADPAGYELDGIAGVTGAEYAWLVAAGYDVIVVDHEVNGEPVYVALYPDRVTLTPPAALNWLRALVGNVHYRDARFLVHPAAPGFHLEMRRGEIRSRPWYLGPWTTESDLVRTALACALAYEEHEAREQFTYQGKAVFGPHTDVQALVTII
jgi:hypothetical protein